MGNWNYNAIGHEDITAENVKRLFDGVEYGYYNATIEGCQAIIDEWQAKADHFDELFRDIPGYVEGEHRIVLRYAWLRQLNKNDIKKFGGYLTSLANQLLVYNLVDGKTRDELESEQYFVDRMIRLARELPAEMRDYHGVQKYLERSKYLDYVLSSMQRYNSESDASYEHMCSLGYDISYYTKQFVDEVLAANINKKFPQSKVAIGQKTNRAVKKLCSILGLDKDENWEKNYARYADAINPLQVDKNVCISWNLYDYLTMSQGNSWQSCHDIDACGCYSSGTLSYALDSTSVVVFMLPDDYKENPQPLWNIPKVKRQMFHIKEDGTMFVQGRLYPDDQTDHGYGCDFSEYENWRNMMQEIVSKAFGHANLWKNKKNSDGIANYIDSNGTNYADYFYYDNCNLSYLTEIKDKLDGRYVSIGHDPICPCCGEEHDETGCCTCSDCREDKVVCADCGRRINRDNAYYIDREYYCGDCVSYCEYHEEYEHDNDMYHISNYGDVCEYGIDRMTENGDIVQCEQCGEYILTSYATTYENDETEEVFSFCGRYCRDVFCREHYPRMA